MNTSGQPANRRGVRVLGIAFLVVFLLLSAAALLIYLGWQGRPSHWTDMQEDIAKLSEDQKQVISDALRNKVINAWTNADAGLVPPEQELGKKRTIEIPYKDLNVWLAHDGVGQLNSLGIELPKSVKTAMVDAPKPGLLRISCELDGEGVNQVVALTFKISVADDGTVTSELAGATAGRLPVPTSMVVDQIAKRGGGEMSGLLSGKPTGPLDHGTGNTLAGRLVGLDIQQDKLVVTRKIVRSKKAKPSKK